MREQSRITKQLIRALKEEPIRKVKFKADWVSFEYDGVKIRNKVVVRKHEPLVGSWAKNENIVYVDDDIKNRKELGALAIHESIEKYVTQRYGLKWDKESHRIALVKEKEFLQRKHGNWRKYLDHINWVWRKEGRK